MNKLEQASRELCRIRGLDADAMIPHGADPDSDEFVYTVCLYSPMWKLVSREVQTYLEIQEALKSVGVE